MDSLTSYREGAELFAPGRNCAHVAHAGRAAPLIDAESYFRSFARAAEHAQESIIILAWDFDSRTPLDFDGATPHVLLGDFLNDLVRRRRRLRIYVLIWDYPMIFGTDRETRPIYGLGWKPRRRVHLRYDNTHPVGGSHHQKIAVIDDSIAFCGGLDLTSKRWDTCEHAADDKRRSVEGTPYPPFHDAMIALDGDAARALGRLARDRWHRATGYVIPPARVHRDAWPDDLEPQFSAIDAAISRTIPDTNATAGAVKEVEALYVDMIRAAESYIYLENQYFTSETIRAALAQRLAQPDPPEIAVVTRRLSHGWLEEATMTALRIRVVKSLRAADTRGRFEVYYPYTPGLQDGTCIDVHSKIAVVDDRWLRIGSANLSNRSMGVDTECDITLDARDDEASRRAVRAARDVLLAEHLGVTPERLRAEVAAQGSLHAAIRQLHCDARTLRRIEDEEEPAGTDTLAAVADPEQPVALDQLIDFFSPDTRRSRGGPAWSRIVPIGCVFLALFLAWRYTPLADWLTADRIIGWARAAADVSWSPIAVILAYVPVAFTLFPRPLLTLFASVAYGPTMGFVIGMSGIALSALAAYYTGRAVSRDSVRRIAGRRLNRTSEVLRRRGLSAAIAVSIAPVAPFVVVGMVAGAVRLRLWQYLLGTLIGMLPGTLVTTFFGDQIAAALDSPAGINYWLVALAIAVMVALVVIVRRWVERVEKEDREAAHRAPGSLLPRAAISPG
ncbi:MAG: VTT domain-containing protein [Burkholderiales bacterium]|nr:VTT domain-containing protein [Burkholderiales bacterium]